MKIVTKREQDILEIIKQSDVISFSAIYNQLATSESERTIKRDLASLVERGVLLAVGGGRSRTYTLPLRSRLYLTYDAIEYSNTDPDQRVGVLPQYQFTALDNWPTTLFSETEITTLDVLTKEYQTKTKIQTTDVRKRELERFIIELSWKSSRIEGNTYTLLDTERLLREGIPSKTNTAEETQMILNHKQAFDFILMNPITTLTLGYIEKIHQLLMSGLITDFGLRRHSVGITGSNYRPLSTEYQIKEAMEALVSVLDNSQTVFDKALTALILISYIQPFVDGNKRTARLLANALLLQEKAAPLSYRDVDEVAYRGSLLVFYEQFSVIPMKRIFIEQYEFAVQHYS